MPETPVRSIHFDAMLSVQKRIRDLKLDYANGKILKDEQVAIRTLPRVAENIDGLPVVCICPAGAEIIKGVTTAQDDWAYPIAVVLIAKSTNDFTALMDDYLYWRGLMMDTFINQRSIEVTVPGVAGVYNVEVSPDVVVDPTLFNNNYFYSGFLIRPYIRKLRGERIA